MRRGGAPPSQDLSPRRRMSRPAPTDCPGSEEGRGGEEGRTWGGADHLKKKKRRAEGGESCTEESRSIPMRERKREDSVKWLVVCRTRSTDRGRSWCGVCDVCAKYGTMVQS